MKKMSLKAFAAAALIAALATGGTAAFAAEVDPFGITPEYTNRRINLTVATTTWNSDGNKTLTPGGYGQIILDGASGISSGNKLQAAARNTSGTNLRYPAEFSRTGYTQTFYQNMTGTNQFFYPSLRATGSPIMNIQGTWHYYE